MPWLPAFVAIVMALRINPYFGNMDDSRFVEFAGISNPLSYAAGFFNPDLGFIRSGSLIIVWPAAWLGYHLGPGAYFLTNVVIVTACLAAFGFAYGRVARWHSQWLFVAFMGASFAWPYTAEMLFFPSLSEKGIILGGAALLLGIWALNTIASPRLRLFVLMIATLFAFSTKTQILLLVPGAIVMLWATENRQDQTSERFLRWTATALWIVCSIGVIALARLGSYTAGTQGAIGTGFLQDRRFQLLMGIAMLYSIAVLWRVVRRHFRATDLVPAAYLFAAASAFSIWEIRNYYLAVASLGVASAAVTVLTWLRGKVVAILAIVSVAVASAWLTYRLPQVYESLASVRQFLQSDTAQQLSASKAKILVSCSEAPDHYNPYADRFNVPGLEFAFAEGDAPSTTNANIYIFADSRLCPWPGSVARDEWEPVWTSPHGSGAFALYSR